MHAMQLACKAAGRGFKIYSICQENYLINFLFTSKVRPDPDVEIEVEIIKILMTVDQVTKVSELLTAHRLGFPAKTWKLAPSALVVIQLCKCLENSIGSVCFVDTFFTNARLFKALKSMGIGACGTAKIGCGFPLELVRLRAAATKQKDWGEMGLMTIQKDEKMNIEDGDVLCMAWVDLNTVLFMTTNHTVDEMTAMVHKDARRRHGIPESAVCIANEEEIPKLPFPAPIVEYNTHMGGSDGNAQQRSYYSPHRPDSRYWWPLMIFLLDAAVLNAFKLWGLLYPESKMTHWEFQLAIIEELLFSKRARK